jgi:two-component system CheB/CheR fusion protein
MAKKKQSGTAKKTAATKRSGSKAKKTDVKKKAVAKPPKKAVTREKEGELGKARLAEAKAAPPLTTQIVPGFPIVGIGASAGGLEALEAFFKGMPTNTGMAFVVVVHLDPTHISILPELLQKRTKMPVCQVTDGMSVEPNRVYVIPPNRNLTVLHRRLNLMELTHPRGANLPIDSLFRSLAQDQGRNAVCVILSGTGTDGTLGVKAIKGEVGMVMVQDEKSAKYEGMPRSAIATGLVDYVLPPEKMPEQLIKYIRHATQEAVLTIMPAEGPISGALQKIFVILRARTNHDFSLYKQNTICRRIERRMNVHQIDDISEYVRYLQESEREVGVLFRELLIGVTNFFRDPEAFEALKKGLQKLLSGEPDDYTVRAWTPGCASGEEAYSVAIVLSECMAEMGRHFHVQIFGTDIDEEAINVARAGLYPESITVDVGPARIGRHFNKEEDSQYRVKKGIRDMLVFAPQNVLNDPPFTKLDLLCCRNLLIYLGAELQKKLLRIFHYSLKPNGILFLGSSETIGQATDLFALSNKKWKIFRRKPSASSALAALDFPAAPAAYETRDVQLPETVQKAEELSALQLVETILHESDTPPCAIINDACNVVYIHGRTGRYLELAEGKVSVNVLEMARPGLKAELATAVREVSVHKREVIRRGLQIQYNGGHLFLDLTVKPILDQTTMRGLMMVMFEETATPRKMERDKRKRQAVRRKGRTAEQLEQELQYTRESLQTTIEELETSNEELKSTNEELHSTNEELQSTNEELETSKEELQSLNEESATVNAELQARIDELAKAHDDMKNLLDSTAIATIFLDTDMRVGRFTPRATEIIPLTAADSGRPIQHFASSLLETDLADSAEGVLRDMAVREAQVQSKDGRHYVMRVRPYRTLADVIDGVVMTFEDITSLKEAERGLRRLAAVVQDSNDAITLQDRTGKIIAWNRGAQRMYGYPEAEALHMNVRDIVPKAKRKEALDFVERLFQGQTVESFETQRLTKDGRTLDVSLTVALLVDDNGEPEYVATTERDVTEQKQAGP